MCWFFPLSLKLGNSREWEVIILRNNPLVPGSNIAPPVHGIREELIWQQHRIHPKHHPLHSRAAAKLPRGKRVASIWTWLGKWARLDISNTSTTHSSKASFPLNLSLPPQPIIFSDSHCFPAMLCTTPKPQQQGFFLAEVNFYTFSTPQTIHFSESCVTVQIKSTSYSVSAQPSHHFREMHTSRCTQGGCQMLLFSTPPLVALPDLLLCPQPGLVPWERHSVVL